MSDITVLSNENYADEIKDGIVVIDFYADWCGPCKMMAPIFAETAAEYAGKVKFFKLNTDDSKSIAIENKIMSIPTLLFYKDGVQVDRVSGVLDKSQLTAKLTGLL